MKTTLHPRAKEEFMELIEAGRDFGSIRFVQLWKLAAFQYQANKAYYDSLTECPLRAVAEDLAAHFDALEESRLEAETAWPTQEEWADFWYRAEMERLRFPARGRS